MHLGASIGYWRGDIRGLVDDIAALRPTFFVGVPRVFDRICAGVEAKVRPPGSTRRRGGQARARGAEKMLGGSRAGSAES